MWHSCWFKNTLGIGIINRIQSNKSPLKWPHKFTLYLMTHGASSNILLENLYGIWIVSYCIVQLIQYIRGQTITSHHNIFQYINPHYITSKSLIQRRDSKNILYIAKEKPQKHLAIIILIIIDDIFIDSLNTYTMLHVLKSTCYVSSIARITHSQ